MDKSPISRLSEYLAGQGLRSTSQRDTIFRIFTEARQHLSAEELYARVKRTKPGIGYATVYRTLRLLARAGLAEELRLDDGYTRFGYKNTDGHHDHLICTRCGAISEFENDRIETLQLDIAREKGFKVHSHKLELYGLCAGCLGKKRK